jgi:hypothetical protein
LELHDANGNGIAANDDWQSDGIAAAQLTAHGLALPNQKEAACSSFSPRASTPLS